MKLCFPSRLVVEYTQTLLVVASNCPGDATSGPLNHTNKIIHLSSFNIHLSTTTICNHLNKQIHIRKKKEEDYEVSEVSLNE
jgi:hypothetical protein